MSLLKKWIPELTKFDEQTKKPILLDSLIK